MGWTLGTRQRGRTLSTPKEEPRQGPPGQVLCLAPVSAVSKGGGEGTQVVTEAALPLLRIRALRPGSSTPCVLCAISADTHEPQKNASWSLHTGPHFG